ncbi:hypothetical protein MVEN_02020500 [Mycena venus]|uniref:Uncharacterized protein n=1 Tax=Mycena venus TaxID=2733690 RepID=A0A8H6XCI8_9AGAR|nr:hypothetical protein MVEN_02020500 [Mycena venus]
MDPKFLAMGSQIRQATKARSRDGLVDYLLPFSTLHRFSFLSLASTYSLSTPIMPPKRSWSDAFEPKFSLANNKGEDDTKVSDFQTMALTQNVSYSRIIEWRADVEQACSAQTIPPATCEAWDHVWSKTEALKSTHHVIEVGELITQAELIKLLQWTRTYDGLNAPILVIQVDAISGGYTMSALAVGMDGYFILNPSTKSFGFNHYLLDEISAVSPRHSNLFFGKRKRVFVERPFPVWEGKRFEFLGEFVVDVVHPLNKWAFQQLPQPWKEFQVKIGQSLLRDPSTQSYFIGNRFHGSQVRWYIENGDFALFVGLTRYTESQCNYIAMPHHGGLPDLDLNDF